MMRDCDFESNMTSELTPSGDQHWMSKKSLCVKESGRKEDHASSTPSKPARTLAHTLHKPSCTSKDCRSMSLVMFMGSPWKVRHARSTNSPPNIRYSLTVLSATLSTYFTNKDKYYIYYILQITTNTPCSDYNKATIYTNTYTNSNLLIQSKSKWKQVENVDKWKKKRRECASFFSSPQLSLCRI